MADTSLLRVQSGPVSSPIGQSRAAATARPRNTTATTITAAAVQAKPVQAGQSRPVARPVPQFDGQTLDPRARRGTYLNILV